MARGQRDQRRRLVIALCCVVYLGGGGGYYAGFSMFAVLGAGLLAQARQRSWRSAATGAVVAAGILVVLLANVAPELAWRATHGVDHSVAQRSLSENERFGLKITSMVLPGPAHQVGFLAAIGRRANPDPLSGRGGQQVGLIAVLGLVSCWWALLRRGVGRREDDPDGLLPMPVALGLLAAFMILLATVDGLGYTFAVGGLTQFRAWSRAVVQIAFYGLLGIAWQLDRSRRARDDGHRWRVVGAATLILLVGLVDQIPVGVLPPYATTRASLESARGFVDSMQAALPDGAMVFEYPVTTFPEAGPTRAMPDYSLAVPYILGDGTLRYSYGGIRGREADWQRWWAQQPMPQQLRGLAAAGFDAVSVDRRAYLANGAAFEQPLVAALGPPAGTSRNGEQSWFDLRPLRASMARALPEAEIDEAGRLITHGIEPSFSGEVGPNRAASDRQDRWIGSTGRLTFTNPLDETREATLRMSFAAPQPASITLDGRGVHQVIELAPGRSEPVVVRLTLPPGGTTRLSFAVDGDDLEGTGSTFPPRARITALRVDEAAVERVTRP